MSIHEVARSGEWRIWENDDGERHITAPNGDIYGMELLGLVAKLRDVDERRRRDPAIPATDHGDDLPPFPVDDTTLAAVEYTLDVALDVGPDGPVAVQRDGQPADMSLPRLLEFLSGPSDTTTTVIDVDVEVEERVRPMYSERDVIRSLITEVHRLRGENR